MEYLAGPKLGWLWALICSPTIVQGTSFIDNPICRLFAPRPGQRVAVTFSDLSPSSLTVSEAAQGRGTYHPHLRAVEIRHDVTSQLINLTICEECQNVAVSLCLQFQYKPAMGFSPIHEVVGS
jgi:fatty acid synthase subunit alpha